MVSNAFSCARASIAIAPAGPAPITATLLIGLIVSQVWSVRNGKSGSLEVRIENWKGEGVKNKRATELPVFYYSCKCISTVQTAGDDLH